MKKLDPIEKSRRARERENDRARARIIKAANERELEASEKAVACSKCCEEPGARCSYVHNGVGGISIWPHVERKRAYGRMLRIATIADVIRRHRVVGESPDAEALAIAIDDALHPKKP